MQRRCRSWPLSSLDTTATHPPTACWLRWLPPRALTYLGLPGGAASPRLPVHLNWFTSLAALNLAGNGQYDKLFWHLEDHILGGFWPAQEVLSDVLPPPGGLGGLSAVLRILTFLDLSHNELEEVPSLAVWQRSPTCGC